MLKHAMKSHYDVAVLVSGDKSFLPAIQMIQEEGQKVEVAAFDEVFNNEIGRACDKFHRLNDIPFIELNSPTDSNNGDDVERS